VNALVALAKTLIVVVFVGAAIVASFYFAYVLVLLCVLALVGVIAYLCFSYNTDEKERDGPDWDDYSD